MKIFLVALSSAAVAFLGSSLLGLHWAYIFLLTVATPMIVGTVYTIVRHYMPDPVVDEAKQANTLTRVIGCIGMVLTVAYAALVTAHFTGLSTATLGDLMVSLIANKLVEGHLLCVVAAAILSAVGFFGRNKVCMLISACAMFASGLLFKLYFSNIILQAVLLAIASVLMFIPAKKAE